LIPAKHGRFTADYTIPAGQTANVVNTVTACGYDYSEQNTEDAKGTCDTDTHILDVLHPAIKVVKSGPDNAQLGTTGTFTFVVTNAGDTALGIAEVTDNIAGAGSYISGDANSNSMLDLAETWVYQATYRFTSLGTVENTVTVCSEDSLEAEVCSTDKHKTIVYQPQVLGDVTPPAPKLQDTGTSLLWQTIAGVALVALGVWVVVRPGKRATYSIRPYM